MKQSSPKPFVIMWAIGLITVALIFLIPQIDIHIGIPLSIFIGASIIYYFVAYKAYGLSYPPMATLYSDQYLWSMYTFFINALLKFVVVAAAVL